jgi:hypothetical protein
VHFPLDDAGTVHYNTTVTWDLLSPTALSAQAFAVDCAAKYGLSAAAATALQHSIAAQICAHLQREPDTVANRSVVLKGAFRHPVAARKMTRHCVSRSAKQRSTLAAAAGDTTAATAAATAAAAVADTNDADCVDAATEAVTSGTKAAGSKKRTSSSSAGSSSAKRGRRSAAVSCATATKSSSSSSGSAAAAKPKKKLQQQQQQRQQQQQQQQQRSSTSSGSDSDSSSDDDWLDDNLPCCMLCTDSELHECECSQCPRSFHIDCINNFANGGAGPTTANTTATGCSRQSRQWVCKWCVHGKGGALQPPLFKV